MLGELRPIGTEQVKVRDLVEHEDHDERAVLDEVGDALPLAHAGLADRLAHEMDAIERHARRLQEAVTLHPVEFDRLDRLVALRDEMDAVSEPLVLEPAQGGETAGRR